VGNAGQAAQRREVSREGAVGGGGEAMAEKIDDASDEDHAGREQDSDAEQSADDEFDAVVVPLISGGELCGDELICAP